MKKLKNKIHPSINLISLFILRGVPFKRSKEISRQQTIHCKRFDIRTKLSGKVVPTQVITSRAKYLPLGLNLHIWVLKIRRTRLSCFESLMKNKRKIDNFDARKCLPQNIIIKSAETQLYRIGLSLHSYDYVIRNKY